MILHLLSCISPPCPAPSPHLALVFACCVSVVVGGAYAPCEAAGRDATHEMGDVPGMAGMQHHGAPASHDPCDHSAHAPGQQESTTGTCQLGLHCIAMTMVADAPLRLGAVAAGLSPSPSVSSVPRNHAAGPDAPPPKA
jgi:hypothetical protein